MHFLFILPGMEKMVLIYSRLLLDITLFLDKLLSRAIAILFPDIFIFSALSRITYLHKNCFFLFARDAILQCSKDCALALPPEVIYTSCCQAGQIHSPTIDAILRYFSLHAAAYISLCDFEVVHWIDSF